jgi:predicted PurR-regulated permease PerM
MKSTPPAGQTPAAAHESGPGEPLPPNPDRWLSRERVALLAFLAITGLAFYLCYRLTLPFLPALSWALALAVVGQPLHRWLARRVAHTNLAAGLAVLVVALVIVVPVALVLRQVAVEATASMERLRDEAASGRWSANLANPQGLAPVVNWFEGHFNLAAEVERTTLAVVAELAALVTGSVWVGTQMLITLFVLFYFFRDRERVLELVRQLVPLSEAETDEVFARVADTIRATVAGTLFVAAIQGFLGGLMFWWLGLPAPALWGVVMALLALVPYLGAFVVWAPAALWLALEGHWGKALLLTIWGTIAIGLIDNLLYPILVGSRLRLHTLPVFIAILGGVALFGAAGAILGPVVLAITEALIHVWQRRGAAKVVASTHPVNSQPPP